MAGGGQAGQQAGVDSFDISELVSKAVYASSSSGRVLINRREGVQKMVARIPIGPDRNEQNMWMFKKVLCETMSWLVFRVVTAALAAGQACVYDIISSRLSFREAGILVLPQIDQ